MVMATVTVTAMHSTINKCCRWQWNAGGVDCGGGDDDADNKIDKRFVWQH
jgi:hypothetical protein